MKVLMLGPAREVHGGISAVVNNYYEAGLDQKVDLTYLATMKEGSKLKKLMVASFLSTQQQNKQQPKIKTSNLTTKTPIQWLLTVNTLFPKPAKTHF